MNSARVEHAGAPARAHACHKSRWPIKVLTAAQMRDVDRRTMELGIPGLILMENAGQRVVEFLAEKFSPLDKERITVICGKGNNGGDGMVIARQLFTRFNLASLDVILLHDPQELRADGAANYRMLVTCGCPVKQAIDPAARFATIVVDAVLGTGITGPASGPALDAIREINTGFPQARVVAVDIPSGMASDSCESSGDVVRADYTVTFTAPKIAQVMPSNCDRIGEMRVYPIGSPPEIYQEDSGIHVALTGAPQFRRLFAPRPPGGNKGDFGHVLVVAGSRGKTGAAAMTGMAALRAGAGLVTVASAESALNVIAAHGAELMTEPLPETESGAISMRAFDYGRLAKLVERKDVIAMGPGLGTDPETVGAVRRVFTEFDLPMVVDADSLNALAGWEWPAPRVLRVMTPHPGEMSRLCGRSIAEIQRDRIEVARSFAAGRGVCLVLKGERTVIAFPDGRVWINPTGTPAMATGGTGDVLTGIIAGFLGQFADEADTAIAAAVYLHGLAGMIGSRELGEKSLIATDLLAYLPDAMDECADVSDSF
jgi:NAD(P)H-hydrate epimerase